MSTYDWVANWMHSHQANECFSSSYRDFKLMAEQIEAKRMRENPSNITHPYLIGQLLISPKIHPVSICWYSLEHFMIWDSWWGKLQYQIRSKLSHETARMLIFTDMNHPLINQTGCVVSIQISLSAVHRIREPQRGISDEFWMETHVMKWIYDHRSLVDNERSFAEISPFANRKIAEQYLF